MERLTKAAIATGGAAVLLLGGAGTMAYWTATGTASGGAALSSGNLEITDSACTGWQYANASGVPLDPAVTVENGIVPGDVVVATCTVTMTGEGDHLVVEAEWAGLPTVTSVTVGTESVTVDTGTPELTTDAGAELTGEGYINMSTSTAAVTASVPITVTWPYGTASTPPAASVPIVDLSGSITVTVTQLQYPSAAPSNPAP